MTARRGIACLGFVAGIVIGGGARGSDTQNTDHAQAAVAAGRLAPTVRWQAGSSVVGDFSCRGRKELALVGVDGPALWVAVFLDGVSRPPTLLELTQFGLSAEQATISIESQDVKVRPSDPGYVGPLPGFRRSRSCKGLALSDDRIDAVHLYWNRNERRFQAWQR